LRTAYLGTSEFAAAVLRRLAASSHAPALVLTPPDSRQGRGRKLAPPPAAVTAGELGLALHRSADVNSTAARRVLAEARPESVIVCAFGQIVSEPLLDEHEMLNVHPSLLPRWRGAAPIERAIMAGDERTGVTIMRVTAGLDSGPIALAEQVPIGVEDYFDDVSARLAELGGKLLVRALDALAAGGLSFAEQDESAATYAEKIAPQERHLDPRRSAAELAWAVRGLNPQIGTHLELVDGERLGVRRARAVATGPPRGRIEEHDLGLVLGTSAGALLLEELQAPGKGPMATAEFLRGNPAPTRAV
jgi:methionyl-tRNA formyltransferase